MTDDPITYRTIDGITYRSEVTWAMSNWPRPALNPRTVEAFDQTDPEHPIVILRNGERWKLVSPSNWQQIDAD